MEIKETELGRKEREGKEVNEKGERFRFGREAGERRDGGRRNRNHTL